MLALGLLAAAAWIIGQAMAWVAISEPADASGLSASSTCCSFNQNNGYGKADLICGAVVFVALVVCAATGRNAARASGIVFGMLIVPFGQLITVVVQALVPLEYEFGLQNRFLDRPGGVNSDTVPNYSPVFGFWLALAGFVILIATSILLAVSARRAGPRPGMYAVPAPYEALPARPGAAEPAAPPQAPTEHAAAPADSPSGLQQ